MIYSFFDIILPCRQSTDFSFLLCPLHKFKEGPRPTLKQKRSFVSISYFRFWQKESKRTEEQIELCSDWKIKELPILNKLYH